MKKTGASKAKKSAAPVKQKFVFKGAGSGPQKSTVPLYVPPSVALNLYDKAVELKVSHDQLSVWSMGGGYKMVRATHGIHAGAYFWEAKVLQPVLGGVGTEGAHVRLGWSTRQGALQAHVGFDKWSFGYRDLNGSKCHHGVRDDKYGASFGPGDIIGCYISLDISDPMRNEIRFFKNGVDQGVAFSGADIGIGVFFPALSLFNNAQVLVNFGPSFVFDKCLPLGTNAVSELQPMSPQDRLVHEANIAELRKEHGVRPPVRAPSPPIVPISVKAERAVVKKAEEITGRAPKVESLESGERGT